MIYSRLFDRLFEVFQLLGGQLPVTVAVELSDDELRSLSAVVKLTHQQILSL